ncbi:hypothetical protein B5V88_15720, partial [Heyndrickxia sporothermodurans]
TFIEGVVSMTNQSNEKRVTDTPKTKKFTINTAMSTINQKPYYPGGSVEEHKNIEEANTILTGDEIKQQNENL